MREVPKVVLNLIDEGFESKLNAIPKEKKIPYLRGERIVLTTDITAFIVMCITIPKKEKKIDDSSTGWQDSFKKN